MGSGGWAFVVGFGVLALAFLSGLKSGKKKSAQKVAEAKQQVKKAETEKELVQESAKKVQEMTAEKEAIFGFFNDFEREVAESRKDGNTDHAVEAAKKLAERAIAWQQRNKK